MDPIEAPSPDSSSVVATLRQLIVNGRLAAGERLVEIPVAAALGVSRTPVRLAFRTLEQEGLLEKAGKRGYVVRRFSEADVRSAIEVRGTLEGLAARHLAERGMTDAVRETLAGCIAEGAAVLAKGFLVDEDIGRWGRLNKRFHDTLVDAQDSRVIADAIARNNHLPFASADSLALDRAALPSEYQKLRIAQLQHQLVFDALAQRESARVEMLMREHAWVGFRYGHLFDPASAPSPALS
ncbi:GntR family transcriptional regulator [Piscinibacter sp.]|uniref:GntR family transcriptional regulator n=1 Tax=Piscinibacter sp. TaxID=1903157 RepID=UPI001E097F7B|nr:GntR family transcriptional regulator [Piscinibacter sp.]MBK7531220.1 GntR family transcriptional regulator [Piscinibacter sp.]